MSLYPDYVFAASQAQQYAWVKEHYPALWTSLKSKVTEGRFVPTGGTWVEMVRAAIWHSLPPLLRQMRHLIAETNAPIRTTTHG